MTRGGVGAVVAVWSCVGVVGGARLSDPVGVIAGQLLPVTAPVLELTQIYKIRSSWCVCVPLTPFQISNLSDIYKKKKNQSNRPRACPIIAQDYQCDYPVVCSRLWTGLD